MAASGSIAAGGLVTNTVHVVGAMAIRPGCEPFLKLGLRVAGPTQCGAGSRGRGRGVATFLVAALVTSIIVTWFGVSLVGSGSGYLANDALLAYWRDLIATSILVAVVATGVMAALALVPGAALVAVGAVDRELDLALEGGCGGRTTH